LYSLQRGLGARAYVHLVGVRVYVRVYSHDVSQHLIIFFYY